MVQTFGTNKSTYMLTQINVFMNIDMHLYGTYINIFSPNFCFNFLVTVTNGTIKCKLVYSISTRYANLASMTIDIFRHKTFFYCLHNLLLKSYLSCLYQVYYRPHYLPGFLKHFGHKPQVK